VLNIHLILSLDEENGDSRKEIVWALAETGAGYVWCWGTSRGGWLMNERMFSSDGEVELLVLLRAQCTCAFYKDVDSRIVAWPTGAFDLCRYVLVE
jgi:hypothetical protein